MISFRFFTQLCCALGCGILIALYLLQNDPRFKSHVEHTVITMLNKITNCPMQGTLTQIQFFPPELIMEDIYVADPKHAMWSYRCKQAVVTLSVLKTLMYWTVPLDITLHHITIFSKMSCGIPMITEHIQKILDQPVTVPVTLHSLSLRKGHINFEDDIYHSAISIDMHANSVALADHYKITGTFENGIYLQTALHRADKIQGTLLITIPINTRTIQPHGSYEGSFVIPQLPSQNNLCFVTGTWNHNTGSLSCATIDRSFLCNGTMLISAHDSVDIQASIHAPLSYLQALVQQNPLYVINGRAEAAVDYTTKRDCQKYSGSVNLSDISIGTYGLGNAHTSFMSDGNVWGGIVTIQENRFGSLTGHWDYIDALKKMNIDLINSSTLSLPHTRYWNIMPHMAHIHVESSDASHIQGSLHAQSAHKLTEGTKKTDSLFNISGNNAQIKGMHNGQEFAIECGFDPYIHIKKCTLFDNEKHEVMCMQVDQNDCRRLKTNINLPYIKQLMQELTDYNISGEGTVQVETIQTASTIDTQIQLEQANVRLLSTYNFIKSLSASVQITEDPLQITIKEALTELYKGRMHVPQATCIFDQQYKPIFMHTPFTIDNVLVTSGKELFIMLSGTGILLKKTNENPVLKATVLIERGQMKKNIFEHTMTNNILNSIGSTNIGPFSDMGLDVTLETATPLHVKTPFLESHIKFNLSIKGTIRQPLISGCIELLNGKLAFPYKPLTITHGQLYFLPGNLGDPNIELVTKGKIKKYMITLRVNGTVNSPTITLESSPHLSEEQIITLLLAGSEEGSFSVVMPALIMNNLQQLLFSSDMSESTLERSFKNLISPFKSISIVPSFNDQTGRGGLRGTLEIDVNDRLTGRIQQNFSLSEDTKFEVEYLISDDISVRGIKDERGDVGGELEMRWKF
jgi:hypothetical protein